MLQLFNLEKHYHQHVIMFMLTLTKKTTMIRIIFLQNHDHGEDNEDDEKHWNFETLLGMCEEHHGSSLGSTSFASNADVVRSKENSHLEVIVMIVALVYIYIYYGKYTMLYTVNHDDANNLCGLSIHTMCSSQNPFLRNQGSSAKILNMENF